MINEHEKDEFSTVSVIGLGYIGLPTAAILASKKVKVVGVDISKTVVETINKGQIHIIEPDLDIVVHAVVTEGYLRATLTPESSDVFIIAVPTPFKEDYEADLSYIHAAIKLIAPVLEKGNLVILESTSPVGTTELLATWISELRRDLSTPLQSNSAPDIFIAYCPERVLPGQILKELIQNNRIIGGMTSLCSDKAAKLYKTFVSGDCFTTNARTAEMCKLTENSFRDVNIAFANELSMICADLNINVWELLQLANLHPRVNILQPGPGVGGHCIAVDPWFIINSAPEQAKLIRSAREVNISKPLWVIDKVNKEIDLYLQENLNKERANIVIACFGLTFKANIDDLRESPALEIVHCLSKIHKGYLMVVEPHIRNLPPGLSSQVELVDQDKAFDEADILIMLVNHKKFHERKISLKDKARIIDVCGIYAAEAIEC